MEMVMDDYEGPLFSAWGRWREAMSEEENEQCLNPLYYVFGSGDTDDYDNSNSTPLSSQFGNILTDSTSLSDTGKFGLYSDREVTPISAASQEVDYYRQGLLIPETSLCSLRVWDGFFFRYFPEVGACHRRRQLEVQQLESRMVKDVQKLKEELNEMELSLGAFATDLPSCIGEVVQAREREIIDERRESVEVGLPLRPRLTASVYSYSAIEDLAETLGSGEQEEENMSQQEGLSDDTTPVNSPHSTPTKVQQKQPATGGSGQPVADKSTNKQTSLAQFTDALYSSELEEGRGLRPKTLAEVSAPASEGGKSPVTKTRLRIVKSHAADPVVAAWKTSPRQVVKLREPRKEKHKDLDRAAVASDSQLTEL